LIETLSVSLFSGTSYKSLITIDSFIVFSFLVSFVCGECHKICASTRNPYF